METKKHGSLISGCEQTKILTVGQFWSCKIAFIRNRDVRTCSDGQTTIGGIVFHYFSDETEGVSFYEKELFSVASHSMSK